ARRDARPARRRDARSAPRAVRRPYRRGHVSMDESGGAPGAAVCAGGAARHPRWPAAAAHGADSPAVDHTRARGGDSTTPRPGNGGGEGSGGGGGGGGGAGGVVLGSIGPLGLGR